MKHMSLAGVGLLALVNGGCISDGVSSGHCLGAIGETPIDLVMDPDSEFHEDDDFLDDDAPVHMSYGNGGLEVIAQWDDMPDDSDVGVHVIPLDREVGDHLSGDMIEWWTTTLPVAAEIETATIEITSSSRSQIVGTFTYRFADATQVDCDFDLRRDRSRDVD